MGFSLDGVWHGERTWQRSKSGEFLRDESTFRSRLESTATAHFPVEAHRYHLYISRACPWAHRVMMVRALFGLEDFLSVSFVHPLMHDKGWFFSADYPDQVLGHAVLHQVYVTANPHYTGRVTVPILYDTRTHQIVNNESSETHPDAQRCCTEDQANRLKSLSLTTA